MQSPFLPSPLIIPQLPHADCQAHLTALTSQLLLLHQRLQTFQQLQPKVNILLLQNAHLKEENELLRRMIEGARINDVGERRRENPESAGKWRGQHRSELYNELGYGKQGQEEERDNTSKLVDEISRLHDQIQDIQTYNREQFQALKNKYQSETLSNIQSLKKIQQEKEEISELKIRKLKEELMKKEEQLESEQNSKRLQNQRLNSQISSLKCSLEANKHRHQHQIELLIQQHQNKVQKITRLNQKSEEVLKNFYEKKITMAKYESQEKRILIEGGANKNQKANTDGELEIVRLIAEKDRLRGQLMKQGLRKHQEMEERDKMNQGLIKMQRQVAQKLQENIKGLLECEMLRLKSVIQHKQEEISSLLSQSANHKATTQSRLSSLQLLTTQLQHQLEQMVLHYEREIELLKIKISQLYETDIEAIKNVFIHQFEQMNNQNSKLKETITEIKDKLIKEMDERLHREKEYGTRIVQRELEYEKEVNRLKSLLILTEKNYENARSQTSLRDIQHGAKLKSQNVLVGNLTEQKRELENSIKNKHKEIDELNLKIGKMSDFHKKEIHSLESTLKKEQEKIRKYQEQKQKAQVFDTEQIEKLREQIQKLEKKLKQNEKLADHALVVKDKVIEQKRLKISQLQGQIEQLKHQLNQQNQQVVLQLSKINKMSIAQTSLLDTEKKSLTSQHQLQKQSIHTTYKVRLESLNKSISDLTNQNRLLRESYEQEKLKSRKLQGELSSAYSKVDQRGRLEQKVVNIGLSNNYFKNISEIFKMRLDE